MVYDIAYRHKDGTLVTNRAAKNIVSIIQIYPLCLIFENDKEIIVYKQTYLFGIICRI